MDPGHLITDKLDESNVREKKNNLKAVTTYCDFFRAEFFMSAACETHNTV